MTREIIQIAASSTEEGGDAVFALCSDSTAWCIVSGNDGMGWSNWRQLPPIPQPESLEVDE